MKNIIFLISDQMQRKAVLEDKNCHMENLRTLVSDSVDFSRMHASNPICSPARASLITGRLPHNHGMVDCTHTVPAYRSEYDYSLETLPQILKAKGYDLSYYGKWHIERSYKLENFGIDEYETELDIPKRKLTPVKRVTIATEGYKTSTVCGVYSEGEEYSEEHYIYDKGIDFIMRKKEEGKPFCLFLSTYAPHDPYVIPKEIYDLYKDVNFSLPETWDDGLENKPELYSRLHEVWKDMSEEQVCEIIRCYYSSCSLVDRQVGRLVEYLKNEKLYDDTLIVFTSDHGDMCGAHGLFCKGVAPFEEAYRIPFVLKMPGNTAAGTRLNTLSDTTDILPTVLDIAAIGSDAKFDGESLLPYIEGRDGEERYTVSEFFGQRFSYTQRVVWHKQWKYIFNAFDRDELYDLENDPNETVNLSGVAGYLEIEKKLCRMMWEKASLTNDWSILDSQYFMHRFAPIGPLSVHAESSERFTKFNKSF